MARIPTCMCPNCNNIGTHKVIVFRRGGEGHGFMCDFHFRNEESYYTKNNNEVGTNKANANTIGVEFETSRSTAKARIEFMASGYIPTQDGTVDVEYKSPIMNGLNSISKHCTTFERLINDGDLEVDETCGTHLHIGNKVTLTPEKLEYIRRFYHSLFIPLCEEMKNNPEATERLFGRPLNTWASPINENTRPKNHTNFINMQHDYTIEFRVCKFVNAKQYMNAAKFCVKLVDIVTTNFSEHFNDEVTDTRRYPTQTAYRKHKADVAARKMVEAFRKFSNI